MPDGYVDAYAMPTNHLIAVAAFSEVSKDPEYFDADTKGVVNVIKNRMARPERFGETAYDVIFAPSQFSGVGTSEWDKAYYRQFKDKNEENLFKKILQITHGVMSGQIEDTTGGADHYYNPELVSPQWAEAYEKTYSSGAHDYHSELLEKVSSKTKMTFKQAFRNARESGRKVFQWRGKKYSTKLAE